MQKVGRVALGINLQSYLKGSDITDNCKAVTKRVWVCYKGWWEALGISNTLSLTLSNRNHAGE